MTPIEEKISLLQRSLGHDATVRITAGAHWVSVEQIVGVYGRVTPGGGRTLDDALDDLMGAVQAKNLAGITKSGRV